MKTTALARTLCALLASASCGLGAQQPLPAPVLKPFADNQQWMLFDDFTYIIGGTRISVTVPKGFVTDFASIPQGFWSFGFSPNGKYSRAAIVHDFLYWSQGCTRLEADNILLIAMKESAVPTGTRDAIYQGVRIGGSSSWDANAAARARGLPRVIPRESMAFGPLALWEDYQKSLMDSGATDPAFARSPGYCALGATTDVPVATEPARQ